MVHFLVGYLIFLRKALVVNRDKETKFKLSIKMASKLYVSLPTNFLWLYEKKILTLFDNNNSGNFQDLDILIRMIIIGKTTNTTPHQERFVIYRKLLTLVVKGHSASFILHHLIKVCHARFLSAFAFNWLIWCIAGLCVYSWKSYILGNS